MYPSWSGVISFWLTEEEAEVEDAVQGGIMGAGEVKEGEMNLLLDLDVAEEPLPLLQRGGVPCRVGVITRCTIQFPLIWNRGKGRDRKRRNKTRAMVKFWGSG